MGSQGQGKWERDPPCVPHSFLLSRAAGTLTPPEGVAERADVESLMARHRSKAEALVDRAKSREQVLEECQEALEYRFQNVDLLYNALTHASGADSRFGSNERLEFLGDAVLGLVICNDLYDQFPDLLEGELTKIKSVVVSRRTCARISRTLGLGQFLVVGRGMALQSVVPASVMAAVFESLVAAIYLDGGLEPARAFILSHMQAEIVRAAGGYHGGNYKSVLQQVSQKEFGATPSYEMLDEEGPDHSKSFKISAVIADRRYPPAWGRNKKEAQQRAALNALSLLGGQEIPFPMKEEEG